MIVQLTLFFLRNVMFIHVYLANKFFISILTSCKKTIRLPGLQKRAS